MSPPQYEIQIASKALRNLARLDVTVRRRIRVAIDTLSENPRPHGVIKLTGPGDLYRIRVGDYRVVYSINDMIRVVQVTQVGHRSKIYD